MPAQAFEGHRHSRQAGACEAENREMHFELASSIRLPKTSPGSRNPQRRCGNVAQRVAPARDSQLL